MSALLTNPEIYTEPGAMIDTFLQQTQKGIMELYGYRKTAHPKKGDGIYTERVDHVTMGALMYGLDQKMKEAKNQDFVKNVLVPQINSLQISQKIAANRMGFIDKYGKGLMVPQDAANFYIDRNFEMKTPISIGELVVELRKLEDLSKNPKDSFLYRNEVQENFLANKLITRFLIKFIDNKGGGDEVAKAVHKLRFAKRGWSYPWQDGSDDGNKLNLKSMNKDWKKWSENVAKEADHVQLMLLQRKLPDPDTIASNNQSKPSWWEGHQLQEGHHYDKNLKVWVDKDGKPIVPVDKDGRPILPKSKVDFDKIKKQGFGKEPAKPVKKQTTKYVPKSAEEFLKLNPDKDPRVAAKKQADHDAYVAHFQGKDAAEVIARRDAAAKKKATMRRPDALDWSTYGKDGFQTDYYRFLKGEQGKTPAQKEKDMADFKREVAYRKYNKVWDKANFAFVDRPGGVDPAKHDTAEDQKIVDLMKRHTLDLDWSTYGKDGIKVDYDKFLKEEKGRTPAQKDKDWKEFKNEVAFKKYDLVWDDKNFSFIDKMKAADKHDKAEAERILALRRR